MKYADGPTAVVEVLVHAPIETVWALVTDINLPARFSNDVPGSATAITSEWLTAVLCATTPGAEVVRFDLDAPQPSLWNLGTAAAQYVEPDARLALVLPGDINDGAASTLSGIFRFVPPRRMLTDV